MARDWNVDGTRGTGDGGWGVGIRGLCVGNRSRTVGSPRIVRIVLRRTHCDRKGVGLVPVIGGVMARQVAI